MKKTNMGTQSIWAGEKDSLAFGATQVPVVHSVSYGYDNLDEWYDVVTGKVSAHVYGRYTNPTLDAFEEKIRILEDAEAATSFSTGMAAISNSLAALLTPGDRVVSIKDTYGGTNKIFSEYLPRQHVDVVLCETGNHEEIEKEVDKGCQVLYLETPTNPTVKITDLERMVRKAREVGAIVIVDNTFATPINQKPLHFGVDLVIHSATKFLGGHADALGGAVCGRKDLVESIFHYREVNGAVLDPMSAYFLLRGMKTLQIRIEKQQENAMKVADYLRSVDVVEDVLYPGFKDHPGHEIAKKQMNGFGSMLAFSVKGGIETVRHLIPKLKYAHRAANLGSVETVVGPARTTSHISCTEEDLAELGIPESLIRYSAGIEDADDLIADLQQAFDALPEHLYTTK
ncbi:cystathionine gamma-synthase family protein [Texcoconibacillus texcoconensis]|uniref:homocysteine desulfhydrase n=1 Tax=Texcoconibacillus texcoconensis TaxID=1095777 RepID=A0A840QS89_9BACI|nr:cystathionine gamma-synthase family protein [Texcoconibacillus texcoconensis]MBB5174183.1 cystathionine gamma-synthase [Texcoconibacillus texcoconensis]